MKRKKKLAPIIENKFTPVLLFCGALGWTAFILTTAIIDNAEQRTAQAVEKFTKMDAVKSSEISELNHKIQQLSSQVKAKDNELLTLQNDIKLKIAELKESELKAQSTQIETEKRIKEISIRSEKLITSILSHILHDSIAVNDLQIWSKILQEHLDNDSQQARQIHSNLADLFFKKGLIEETKLHLKLANGFNKEQEERLLKGLGFNSAIEKLKVLVANNNDLKLIENQFKFVDSLVQQLANDPSKKEEYLKYSTDIIELRTELALKAPPKEAIQALSLLLNSQLETTLIESSLLVSKIHFLKTATNAYQLSNALGQTEDQKKFESLIDQVVTLLVNEESAKEVIYTSRGIVALAKLDALFIEGEPSQIFKAIDEVEKAAKNSTPELNIILTAAAQGHRASVYYEQGRITNSRDILLASTKTLRDLCESSVDNSFAHFRLGILYWLQAQLTNSKDNMLVSLKTSKQWLTKSISISDPIIERSVLQFSAMVEGDLGHMIAEIGKKEESKTHFTEALNHWKMIEEKWGQTSETKEGVSFCEWRIKQL